MKDALRKVNRAVGIILFLAGLGSLAGCATDRKPFELFDETTVIKPTTVAVISADGSEATLWLAAALTKELKARSTLKVFSQAKVGLRLGKYPITVKKGQPATPEKPVWFGKGEKAKVDAMQAQLKAKYLFVVWTKLSRIGTSATYNVRVDANVVEYPKGRVIGFSSLPDRKSEGHEINRMLKDSAAMIADRFIRTAKAETHGQQETGSH